MYIDVVSSIRLGEICLAEKCIFAYFHIKKYLAGVFFGVVIVGHEGVKDWLQEFVVVLNLEIKNGGNRISKLINVIMKNIFGYVSDWQWLLFNGFDCNTLFFNFHGQHSVAFDNSLYELTILIALSECSARK